WETYARHNPIAANGVASIFSPDAKLSTEMFVAGKSGGDQYVKNVIQAAHRDGPDGALTVIGEQGPEGLGMTDRIRNLQADMEAWLIRSGHMDKVPMAQEWVAQTMHQGTVSHLVAADAALLRGDTTGAINHLMKGNGFFPDGAYARAGVDKSGNIWVYRITEKGDNVIGKPFQVTHEGLQTQIVALQNPTTFQKTLQAMQKENAGIDLHKAQTEWYKARPEIEAMKTESREAIANARMEAARQLQADRDQMARDRMEEKSRNDKERGIRIAEHNTHLEEEANKLYPADEATVGTEGGKFTAEEYPVAANIYRQLRKHPEAGGANLSSVDAYRLANGLAAGVSKGSKNPAYRLDLFGGEDGKPKGYGVVDKSGKVLKTLTLEQGELVKGIVGLAGSAPLQAPGNAPPSTTAPALPRPQFTPAPAASPPTGAQPGARTDTAPGMIMGALPMQGLSRAA
ncbi:MAG TPA: hypothetical protein VNO55_14770, partial [Polyangia bacterium]|nr:hypothetical protein [Polyangia bacterium]